MIQAAEMIHMGVAYEDMADAQDIAGGQAVDAADIEEHGALFESQRNEQSGIFKGAVDQAGMKARPHTSGKMFFYLRIDAGVDFFVGTVDVDCVFVIDDFFENKGGHVNTHDMRVGD